MPPEVTVTISVRGRAGAAGAARARAQLPPTTPYAGDRGTVKGRRSGLPLPATVAEMTHHQHYRSSGCPAIIGPAASQLTRGSGDALIGQEEAAMIRDFETAMKAHE